MAYNAAPVAYNAAPVVAAAPAPVVAAPAIPYAPSSQFQAQDEFGNVNYGYSNINSQKHEVGNAYGGVTGGYSYVDANGELQRVEYIADAAGFRVKATNLPVAPEAPEVKAADLPVAPVFTGVAPKPVEKTAEVLEAEAAFFKKFEEAKRAKRSIALPYAAGFAAPYAGYPYAAAYPYAAPAVATTYAGLAPVVAKTPASTVKAVPAVQTVAYAAPAPVTYAAAAPIAYSAPVAATYAAAPAVAYAAPAVAAKESVLETVKLNPGHATAYRVY